MLRLVWSLLIQVGDDDDSALRSVCRSASKRITRRSHAGIIYRSVSEMDSGSADSALNILLILTSFSSFFTELTTTLASASFPHAFMSPLLPLILFCSQSLTFTPPGFLLDLFLPFSLLVSLRVREGLLHSLLYFCKLSLDT